MLIYMPPNRDQTHNQACALTGNRTSDSSVCRMMPNTLNHNGQVGNQMLINSVFSEGSPQSTDFCTSSIRVQVLQGYCNCPTCNLSGSTVAVTSGSIHLLSPHWCMGQQRESVSGQCPSLLLTPYLVCVFIYSVNIY